MTHFSLSPFIRSTGLELLQVYYYVLIILASGHYIPCTMSAVKHSLRRASRFHRRGPSRSFSCTREKLSEEARIVEVGPRDGLQNEKSSIPLPTKLELIRRLAGTGLRDIEAGSFVSPKWVPQVCMHGL